MACCGKQRKDFKEAVNQAKTVAASPIAPTSSPSPSPIQKTINRYELIKNRQDKIKKRAERIARRQARIAARNNQKPK